MTEEERKADLEALIAIVTAVNMFGGIRFETFGKNKFAVLNTESGFDLAIADAYLLACKALKDEPKVVQEFDGPSPYLCYIGRFKNREMG